MSVFSRMFKAGGVGLTWGLVCGLSLCARGEAANEVADSDLRFLVYATVDSGREWLGEPQRAAAVDRLRALGVDGVILEVNRGGTALAEDEARQLRDYFREAGFSVMGGIATVPGGEWGVPANEGLAWMNFQHPKTQADLEASMRSAARVFDRFVVDDFLLSGDKSALSDQARGRRPWGTYRRDLMTAVSLRSILRPAREENPGIRLIVKFPQHYDRYHEFGYDAARMPQLYDSVWVGTETRGQYTQRFGFTQPYEGFVNYRWLQTLAGEKMEAAWFDFGDCDATDYVEQAWQTVLAGAREIVLFSYNGIAEEHPGLALLQRDRQDLETLADAVARQPVTGVRAYKPPNSDPASDMYVMDFLGMLGVPVVPESRWPEAAEAVFVPAYGAGDPDILTRIEATLARGGRVTVTSGLLAQAPEGDRLARLVGVAPLAGIEHRRVGSVLVDGAPVEVPRGLDLAARVRPEAARVVLEAMEDGEPAAFLTTRTIGGGTICLLNLHMFTEADFAEVGEVLLSPRNPGLLDVPPPWANAIRAALGGGGEILADAPTRVTLHPLGEQGWFVHNYNTTPASFTLREAGGSMGTIKDGFSGATLHESGAEFRHVLPPRSRVWLRR